MIKHAWRTFVLFLALCAFPPAYAADMCGKARGGQYSDELLCANVLLFADGKPATAAMLDSILNTTLGFSLWPLRGWRRI
jgi:hypothetical protein